MSLKSLSVTIVNPDNLSQYYSESSDSSDDRPERTQLREHDNMCAFSDVKVSIPAFSISLTKNKYLLKITGTFF